MIKHLKDLTHDPKNARRHNLRNVGMLEKALNEVGAARSIVIDEDGVVLAGNATIDAAAQAGIERVRVVEADGNEIIAVQRKGLTPEQKTKLALYDNRVAELADWEPDVLAELAGEMDLSALFNADELALYSEPAADEWGGALSALPEGDRAPFQQMTFTLSDEQAEQVRAAGDQLCRWRAMWRRHDLSGGGLCVDRDKGEQSDMARSGRRGDNANSCD